MMAKEFKKLTLTIDGGNAAFGGSPEEAMSEVTRIIEDRVMTFLVNGATFVYDHSSPYTKLSDLNGNTVGRIDVEYETTFDHDADHDAEIDF